MPTTVEIVSLIDLTPEQLAGLEHAAPGASVHQHTLHPGDDPAPFVRDAEVLLTFSPDVDPAQAPRLRWVQVASAGVDRFLNHPLIRSDVQITTASGIHAAPMVEHIMAMMLAWRRLLPQAWRWQTRHEWPQGRAARYRVAELHGATLGVVGYGSIGRHLARVVQAMGMRVLALRRSEGRSDDGWVEPGTGDPGGDIPERFYGPGELTAMLPLCDYVAITLPLTPQTHHLIGARELAAMKPSAFLVNIGRGAIVDEAALIRALQQGTLAGAGLDVFEQEPVPAGSPLYDMENVIMTPHVAGLSARYSERLTQLFAENLARYVAGRPLLNLVDRQRGY